MSKKRILFDWSITKKDRLNLIENYLQASIAPHIKAESYKILAQVVFTIVNNANIPLWKWDFNFILLKSSQMLSKTSLLIFPTPFDGSSIQNRNSRLIELSPKLVTKHRGSGSSSVLEDDFAALKA